MKIIILILLTVIGVYANWVLALFDPEPIEAQEISYLVQPMYINPIKKEVLNKIETLRDLIGFYPYGYKTELVEVSTTCNGKIINGVGCSDSLNTEQKNSLRSADIGSNIYIKVNCKIKNVVTNSIEDNETTFSLTVIPDVDAIYNSGNKKMMDFIKQEVKIRKAEEIIQNIKFAVVKFTVNENGKIVDAQISETSDRKTDKLLLGIINRMPKWKPAENADGEKTMQDFEFIIGKSGC